jgi:hypothetical protein
MSKDKRFSGELVVPVSVGEVADKISILKIKAERITDPAKLVNVTKELQALDAVFAGAFPELSDAVQDMLAELKAINEKLWVIEDDIRDCERAADFGPKFVELARAVYFTNDDRARVKKAINLALGSAYVEEKSYASVQ